MLAYGEMQYAMALEIKYKRLRYSHSIAEAFVSQKYFTTAADGGGSAADGGGSAADGGGSAVDGGGSATLNFLSVIISNFICHWNSELNFRNFENLFRLSLSVSIIK